MKYLIIAILMIGGVDHVAFGAEQTVQETQVEVSSSMDKVPLPDKDTPEYWNVRMEAISEFLPVLTEKRSEMKNREQMLKDFLLSIDKASDFAAKNIPVPTDINVFFEILRIGQGLEAMNMPKPTERPSWEDIMSIVMQHVVFEGYVPTDVEEGEDSAQYAEICRKKEEYGQKVRKDLRTHLDQCARMWVYLDSTNKLDEFKAFYADLQSEAEMQKAQAKALASEQHREAVAQRQADREQQEFEDAQARKSFASSRQAYTYTSRQTRLNSRAQNAGINIYGF